jgi:hypothetical protein
LSSARHSLSLLHSAVVDAWQLGPVAESTQTYPVMQTTDAHVSGGGGVPASYDGSTTQVAVRPFDSQCVPAAQRTVAQGSLGRPPPFNADSF